MGNLGSRRSMFGRPRRVGPAASGGFGLDTSLPTERCSTIGCMVDCRWTRGFDCRATRRRVFVCPQAASLEALDAWYGLRTVLAVETIRGVNGSGTVEAEIRYFLSSCGDDPKVLIQAIRRHWTIVDD